MQREMPLCFNILALLLLQPTLTTPPPLTAVTVSRGCLTCKGTQPSTNVSVTALAQGEPCGVYTPSCAHGLRCSPPVDEPRPLRALLEGRGTCNDTNRINPTDQILTEAPATTEDPEEPPCRKLLTNLIKGLNAHLFQSHHDIYMPNCDKHGFFRKKQCWSSRGKQRGKCWCVDGNGMPLPSYSNSKGSQTCHSS
ncbi:insulin-like growth factor-binding protein 6 [Genypterus blacodes]|uniref:insulin-like growth factor-binding protein 6 n=1 Tax=Genypterus blacodes TaxID=154954 RepID=UPI003F76CD6C